MNAPDAIWNRQAQGRAARLARAASVLGTGLRGKQVETAQAVQLLSAVIESGDRVCLEGNNQKQADFLARTLTQLDPQAVHDLHMVQSVLALPEHLDVFDNGIASRLDFSFSGPQAGRLAKMVSAGQIQIGAIHTYLELFARRPRAGWHVWGNEIASDVNLPGFPVPDAPAATGVGGE